jgi:N-acetylmuramoyl-L-alanine amidase
MTDGEKMLRLAETRIGEKYVNVCVPKNNKNWHGPWDCAEFMSWLVFQIGDFLYGCVDDEANPATVEAHTGAWKADSGRLGRRVPWKQAAATVGGILLRYPPGPGMMGHIVVCDGEGGTVEAMGSAFGVRRGKVTGRNWDTGIFLPNFTYAEASDQLELASQRSEARHVSSNLTCRLGAASRESDSVRHRILPPPDTAWQSRRAIIFRSAA